MQTVNKDLIVDDGTENCLLVVNQHYIHKDGSTSPTKDKFLTYKDVVDKLRDKSFRLVDSEEYKNFVEKKFVIEFSEKEISILDGIFSNLPYADFKEYQDYVKKFIRIGYYRGGDMLKYRQQFADATYTEFNTIMKKLDKFIY